MKKDNHSQAFLDALRTVPVVQVACDKVGLSRNTVYRWKREDADFAEEFDAAIVDGIEYVNDMSESQLLQLIKDRKFPAVRYWLSHHHKRFKSERRSDASSVMSEKDAIKEYEEVFEQIDRMDNLWASGCACSTCEDSDNERKDKDHQDQDNDKRL